MQEFWFALFAIYAKDCGFFFCLYIFCFDDVKEVLKWWKFYWYTKWFAVFFLIERYIGFRLLRVDVKHRKNLEWPYHTDTINFEIDFVPVQFYWLQLFLEAHKTYYINVSIMTCIDYLWPMKTWVSRNKTGREKVYRAVWPQTSKKLQRPFIYGRIGCCNILFDNNGKITHF